MTNLTIGNVDKLGTVGKRRVRGLQWAHQRSLNPPRGRDLTKLKFTGDSTTVGIAIQFYSGRPQQQSTQ